jgi:sulfur transfer complex TusBCD TusB component (DsrH family)
LPTDGGRRELARILAILRRKDDQEALALAQLQARYGQVSLLYLHDAVYREPDPELPTFASRLDVEARGIKSSCRLVSDEEIVRLIFDHDKVICW